MLFYTTSGMSNKIDTTINYTKHGMYEDIEFEKINCKLLSKINWLHYDNKCRRWCNSKKNHTKLFKKSFYDKIMQ